ncbi:MAG: hypothetical protein Kow0077_03380 [Anaerolineae bacterium]
MTGTRGGFAEGLRLVAERLNQPRLVNVVRQPGINEAYRLTVQYHDGRFADSVATLTVSQRGEVGLQVVFRRLRQNLTLSYTLAEERYRALDAALRRLRFDRLADQPDLPLRGADLWLVERASGSFAHDVVLAPAQATEAYAELVDLLSAQLPEALRQISVK